MSTIYALSSGRPPAAIAIMRISGDKALAAAQILAGSLPPPRHAALRRLTAADGAPIDDALVLVFPGPASATGEDLVELHLHGGRAIVARVEQELGRIGGVRSAAAGEFTRRALVNGRIDLAQAHGLADLLEAETEAQRRAAFAASDGEFSRKLAGWREAILDVAALVEAELDFSDEGDVALPLGPTSVLPAMVAEIDAVLMRPAIERLRDGYRIVIAGPPNTGKSSLLNAMTGRDAAIVTSLAGTTRDAIEVPVSRKGDAYVFVDTAGIRESTDTVERIGIERAHRLTETADLVLWLGDPAECRETWLQVHARCDVPARWSMPDDAVRTDIADRASIERLWEAVTQGAATSMSFSDETILHAHQREELALARNHLMEAGVTTDPLIVAEELRSAVKAIAALAGENMPELLLNRLFARFCIGK